MMILTNNAEKIEQVTNTCFRLLLFLNHFVFIGFLCGKCPEGQGVDLTLRQCRNCSIRDSILVVIISKFIKKKKK